MEMIENDFAHTWKASNPFMLPDALAVQYQVQSCFRYSGNSASYLLKNVNNNKLVLLKTASDPILVQALQNEKQLLDVIHNIDDSEFPRFFPQSLYLEKHDGITYFMRTFIQGVTLDNLCETASGRPGLTERQALMYIIDLTEQLKFLHSLTPAVIHRDIKPQNVVVDSVGKCHFIDMGISRQYDKVKTEDTLIMGTRHTAPPEQFGFRQTDIRSDIYSMGVLLLYCLTGDYDLTEDGMDGISEPIRDIIKKATMFDPDMRYKDTSAFLEALLVVRYGQLPIRHPSYSHKKKCNKKVSIRHIYTAILATAVLSLCLFAGFSYIMQNKWMSENPQYSDETVYHFKEPLIEMAVCLQLQKDIGTITYGDLRTIQEIRIVGMQIYQEDNNIWMYGNNPYFNIPDVEAAGLYLMRGSIRSLEDILYMPNLNVLCLHKQQLEDISLLENTKISHLGLGYNPLTDLSPLTGNPSIEILHIPALAIQDTQVLSTLPNLKYLILAGSDITALTGLENCPIEYLDLSMTSLEDYQSLGQLVNLYYLELPEMNNAIAEMISTLPISILNVKASNDFSLEKLSGMTELRELGFNGVNADPGDWFTLHIGNPVLPQLKSMTIGNVVIEDFTAMAVLENLECLYVDCSEVKSYEGLDMFKNLTTFECKYEDVESVKEMYPNRKFKIEYPH